MMKRVVIIGCAGSGKSYFSRGLHRATGLPLYHLDNIYWRPDGTTLEKSEFYSVLDGILEFDEWIIDGNYSSTMEKRMVAADTVFFFDIPTEACLSGIEERRGKPRSDMAWQTPPENDDREFVEFIKNFNFKNRPGILELFEKYPDKRVVVFKSRDEADEYLSAIK